MAYRLSHWLGREKANSIIDDVDLGDSALAGVTRAPLPGHLRSVGQGLSLCPGRIVKQFRCFLLRPFGVWLLVPLSETSKRLGEHEGEDPDQKTAHQWLHNALLL